jgi:hypothetical protein
MFTNILVAYEDSPDQNYSAATAPAQQHANASATKRLRQVGLG